MSLVSSTAFAAEKYLHIKPPDYEYEYLRLTILLRLLTGLLVVSFLLPRFFVSENQYVVTVTTKKVDHRTNEKKLESVKVRNVVVRNVPLYCRMVSFIGIVFCCVMIARLILTSPNNTFSIRRVFEAPLLTEAEGTRIIEMSERAAERNAKRAAENVEDAEKNWVEYEDDPEYKTSKLLLQEPLGWQKLRHGTAPTTDLNIVEDPYTMEERMWVRGIFDRRLAPTLSRIYGIPVTCMSVSDIFVVRYSGDSRVALEKHLDGGDITVTVTLNSDFVGGGTRFWNRAKNEPFAHLSETPGKLVTFPASILHEGVAISSGRRYLLVTFVEVDRSVDGAKTVTGISPFATYLNINWLYRTATDCYERNMDFMTSTFSVQTRRFLVNNIYKRTTDYGDTCEHGVFSMVKKEDYMSYISALDQALSNNSTTSRSPWWKEKSNELVLPQLATL